jgi:hypothetical protein
LFRRRTSAIACWKQNQFSAIRNSASNGDRPPLREIKKEISVIRRNSQFARTLVIVSIAGIFLLATSATPAFAGSGGFNSTGSMKVVRTNHTAALLSNGEVLVAGGNNNTDGYLSSAEVYNPSTGKWTLTGSMTVPRIGHDAVLLQNGQVLVAGGANASTPLCTSLATAELYNPATGTWTATGSMKESVGRFLFTLTLLSNGKVLAAGGANCGNGGLLSAELYNPATGTWTATGTMTGGNQSTGAVLLQNGRVFVVGNDNLYNPSTGNWAAAAKDPIGGEAPAVLLPNGDVFAAGTIQGDSIYNPSTEQWTTFAPPPCTTSRQNCEGGGALLNTGKVLVAGGITQVPGQRYLIDETNGLAALLDPSTLTWTTTASMKVSRVGETVTVLLNGEVLFAGGETFNKTRGNLTPIASAEFYTP